MARPSARQRGYTRRWDVESRRYRMTHPLCVDCMAHGRVTQADLVDHIKPHKGDQELLWDRDNWQSLCKPCHDRHKQKQEIHGYSTEVGSDGWPVDPEHPANKK